MKRQNNLNNFDQRRARNDGNAMMRVKVLLTCIILMLISLSTSCNLSEPIYPTATYTPQPPIIKDFDCQASISPWDISWLLSENAITISRIDNILANTGLAGYGNIILQNAIDYQVNPALALAMFRKEATFAAPGTRANKNNNPGNIIATGECRGKPAGSSCSGVYGETSTDGRFGVYPDMNSGIKAYFQLLHQEYSPGSKRDCTDIQCIIRSYCPPSDCDTQKYIDQVTEWGMDYQCQQYTYEALPSPTPLFPSPSPISTISPTVEQKPMKQGKIAFISNRDGNFEIYIMDDDGDNQIRLTYTENIDELSPIWSPDGKKIAFISYIDSKYNIYTINADGSNWKEIFQDGSDLNWSPDSQKIAFHSRRGGSYQIYIMGYDGRNIIKLTETQDENLSPYWSPDGRKIAFTSNRDGNPEIYVMNPDGSDQTRLTNNPSDDWLQCWSPDNKKIVFVSSRDGNREIYSIDANGDNLSRLTNNPAEDKWVVWSPDSLKIGFTRAYENGQYEGYVMSFDGSNQNKVIDDPIIAWSPDGEQIVFSSSVEGIEEIFLLGYDGKNLIKLTYIGSINRWPTWSATAP